MTKSLSFLSPPNVTVRGTAGVEPVNAVPSGMRSCSTVFIPEPSSVRSIVVGEAKPMLFLSPGWSFAGIVMVCVVWPPSEKPSGSPCPVEGMVRMMVSASSCSLSSLMSTTMLIFPSSASPKSMRTGKVALASPLGPKLALSPPPVASMTKSKGEAGGAEISSRTVWSSVGSLALDAVLSN